MGFKYQKSYDWLDLNSKQEELRLVGFKYQKGYDWLDSQFHCSYLESRGVPGEDAGNDLPFISGLRLPVPVTSFPVMSFPVMYLPVTSFPVMQLPVTSLLHHK